MLHNLIFALLDAVSFYFSSIRGTRLEGNFKKHKFLDEHYKKGEFEKEVSEAKKNNEEVK